MFASLTKNASNVGSYGFLSNALQKSYVNFCFFLSVALIITALFLYAYHVCAAIIGFLISNGNKMAFFTKFFVFSCSNNFFRIFSLAHASKIASV